MMTLIVFLVSTVLGTAYALVLKLGEDRRQEWRRNSRAAWVKS